ncbi:MAG TPA: Na+/H+ antiporter subunit E [Williamwhitmania sp.]|nr:Na+/H+ antiporter subunit E [Williamwhitmania sp.]
MKQLKNGVVLFAILLIIWGLLNNTFDPIVWITGAALALVIAAFSAPQLKVFSDIRLTPAAFLYTIIYLVVFAKDLLLSNLDVARRVISPKMPINPGIVEAKTTLKSPMARMILANSITLTPGTFTVEMREEMLYIHCLDVTTTNTEEATIALVRKFEKYLEVIYG